MSKKHPPPVQILNGDNIQLAGNWYPFPPPIAGVYDLRRTVVGSGGSQFSFYERRRVYEDSRRRLMCMGRRVTRMLAGDGWQFKFLQELDKGVPVNWRPFALIYKPVTPGQPPELEKKIDISQQLPFARSRDEALYIVRQIPDRWPAFRKIHVEYTEEKLQS